MNKRNEETSFSSRAVEGESLSAKLPPCPASKRNPWRILAAASIIAAGCALLTAVHLLTLDNKVVTGRDFIQYWVVGSQLLHHQNPYDVQAILNLEWKLGMDSREPRVTLSPPVAFFAVMPLGLVSPKTGFILWWFLNMGCLSVAIWMLWRLHGRPDNRFHLFGYVFTPALVCLWAGQLSIFFLLGIVVFLTFYESRPAIAGAALAPCALKPHLFLVFALVLLLWVIGHRSYRVLAGFSATLLATCAGTVCFDFQVWSQYFRMMSSTRILQVFVPTFGVALRFLIDRNALWLQFVPFAIGATWAIYYYWTRRGHWRWMDQGPLLLLVSTACAPYGAFTDECILLPFILAGLYRTGSSPRAILPLLLINGIAFVEVIEQVNIMSPYYLWTSPAWLAWYLFATGRIGSSLNRNHDNPVVAS